MSRTVEDFDDWTNWLMYKGGVGVKETTAGNPGGMKNRFVNCYYIKLKI